ncbi:bglB [Symbiodinium sp. CCMP2456]|nr:bglB [Symbiodinium sp. CCMP2456]
MNAAQGVARTAGELELAMAMVTRAKLLAEQGLAIDWDVVQADVAATVPDASPQTVAACGLFCRFYAGGSEAPLLKFLHDFSLKYGASKRLGEEFMSTVAGLRFAGQERSHAFARAAMIATNLTATKVIDGVARLLNKSDVSRLCAKGMEDAIKDWEDLLARAWAHTQAVTEASARAKAIECFGRLMVRSTLFMCKKEKAGQEGLELGSLANLLSVYEHEMGGKSAGATAAAATKDEPCHAAPATLENMQDPAFLMKLQGFAEGKLYKGRQKYQDMWPWKLEKISQSKGSFSLCCPVSWDKKVEVPLSELKKFFELYSGDAPEVVSDSVDRLPHNTEACSQERLRGEFFELCCEYFLKYSQCEEELTFLKNPTCCLLEGKAKTGKLTIFPFTDQISKIGSKPAAGSVEEHQSKRQAEKLKEQSSGLFGGADSEAALVSVAGTSPRKAAKTRLSRHASREARAEQNVLKVAWMGMEIRVLEAGHVTDVCKVHLDDMALFFEATEGAVLTAESFQTRARQSFPKGTAAKDKVVKIGQGRQAQRTGDDRKYSLVKKAGAKARPLDPLPLQEAEVTPAAKRAAKSQGQPSKRRKPGVLVD